MKVKGTEEMAEQFLLFLHRIMVWSTAPRAGSSQPPVTLDMEDLMTSSGLRGYLCMWGIHAYSQAHTIHTHN